MNIHALSPGDRFTYQGSDYAIKAVYPDSIEARNNYSGNFEVFHESILYKLQWAFVASIQSPKPWTQGMLKAPVPNLLTGGGKGCPACGGETELKTFSSFSYTYCPACKEDVAALKPKPGNCDCGLEYVEAGPLHKSYCSTQAKSFAELKAAKNLIAPIAKRLGASMTGEDMCPCGCGMTRDDADKAEVSARPSTDNNPF